jgi:hypothetical protein
MVILDLEHHRVPLSVSLQEKVEFLAPKLLIHTLDSNVWLLSSLHLNGGCRYGVQKRTTAF